MPNFLQFVVDGLIEETYAVNSLEEGLRITLGNSITGTSFLVK